MQQSVSTSPSYAVTQSILSTCSTSHVVSSPNYACSQQHLEPVLPFASEGAFPVLKSAVNKLGCPVCLWIVASFLILSKFSVNIPLVLGIFSRLSLVSETNSGDSQGSVASVWCDQVEAIRLLE